MACMMLAGAHVNKLLCEQDMEDIYGKVLKDGMILMGICSR